MTRLVALVGPTGVGKTDVGIALAMQLGAEIINADSRQVYRHLDIGSAKPTPEQRRAVAHHVIDVVDPDAHFDCAQFRRLALEAIADITRRGKHVLVVGGTGLYVKVLLRGLFEGPASDPGLRTQLQAEEDAAPGSLHRRLAAVDPVAAARLHPNDRTRLIRSLEVHALTGRPISLWQAEHAFAEPAVDALVLGVSLPRAALYARINARCDAMIAAGLADEVQRLYAAGFGPTLPALCSPGYREIGEYVRGQCDLPTALARMAQATRRLAKRQMTWFRSHPPAEWYAPEVEAVSAAAEGFWEGH